MGTMIRYGHYDNAAKMLDELDPDEKYEVIREWEKAIYENDAIQTAADAHFLLRRMLHDALVRQDQPDYDFDAPFEGD